jgi:hypothetical protein
MRRRLVTLVVFLAFIAILWSAGWFALASWVEGRVAGVLAEIEQSGVSVECGDRDIVGFPFALKVACGETDVTERTGGGQARIASVTGGASVFSPMTATIDLGSPARVESPRIVTPAEFRWDAARIGVGMGLNGPQSVSFQASDATADLPIPEIPGAAVAAEAASGRLSPADDGGSDVTLSFSGLTVSGEGKTYPPASGTAALWISAPPLALIAGREAWQLPLSARNARLSLDVAGVRLETESDLTIDAEGILDGTVVLRVAGASALPGLIAQLPPERQKAGNAVAGAILAFGAPTTIDGEEASELSISIERGEARIGPVSVSLPRLPL